VADAAAGGAGRLCPRHRTHALRQGVRRRRLPVHREGDRVGGSRRHGGRQGEGIRSCQVPMNCSSILVLVPYLLVFAGWLAVAVAQVGPLSECL